MKAPKKFSRSYLQRRRNRETGTARVLPKMQEIFKTVVNSVSSLTRDSQFAIILLSASEHVEKKFRRNSIQVRYRGNEEPDKKSLLGLKNA